MSEHPDPVSLDRYVENSLPQTIKVEVEEHLGSCTDCQARLPEHQRLLFLASHLPVEQARHGLAFQVKHSVELAIRQRLRDKLYWRRVRVLSASLAVLGMLLIASAWREVLALFIALPTFSNAASLESELNAWLGQPLENSIAWLTSGLNWQTGLSEGASIALIAGLILISLAAFGGLAQLLQTSEAAAD